MSFFCSSCNTEMQPPADWRGGPLECQRCRERRAASEPAADAGGEPPPAARRGPSWALPVGIGILLAGVWLGWGWNRLYWARRDAGSTSGYYFSALEVSRLELDLRCAAVRRSAARTGKLPAKLSDCGGDDLGLEDWAAWAREVPSSGQQSSPVQIALERLNRTVAEREFDADDGPPPGEGRPAAERPDPDLDFLGLPIVYVRGKRPGGGSWVGSADPFSPEVEQFLAAKGGVPPPASEPFALGSIFARERLEEQGSLDRWALFWTVILPAGLGLIVVGTILAANRLRLPTPRALGKIGLGAAGLLAGLAALVGLGSTAVTCYAPARFSAGRLPAEERLRLLERAAERGQLPAEVVRKARAQIESLSGRR
jgi:hypothetical protein